MQRPGGETRGRSWSGLVVVAAGISVAVLTWYLGPYRSAKAARATATAWITEATTHRAEPQIDPAILLAVAPTSAGAMEGAKARAHTPRFNPLDWDLSNFPGGLANHVNNAIATGNGIAAFELAAILQECGDITRQMTVLRARIPQVKEAATQRALTHEHLAMQSFAGQCQAFPDPIAPAMKQLLQVATDADVLGAAAKLYWQGDRNDRTLTAIGKAALSGHLASLAMAISEGGAQFGLNDSEQNGLRIALYAAAQDPVLTSPARDYVEMAEHFHAVERARAAAGGGSSVSKTEAKTSTLPIDRTPEAEAIAQGVLEQMRASKAVRRG